MKYQSMWIFSLLIFPPRLLSLTLTLVFCVLNNAFEGPTFFFKSFLRKKLVEYCCYSTNFLFFSVWGNISVVMKSGSWFFSKNLLKIFGLSRFETTDLGDSFIFSSGFVMLTYLRSIRLLSFCLLLESCLYLFYRLYIYK